MKAQIRDDKAIRITVDLKPKFYKRLEALEELVGASTKAEVIREALQLFEFMATKAAAGCEFKIVENGEDKAILMFGGLTEAATAGG
jgi:hypothetical protein